jgi:raffinose/stachyose/melibiose transport system permease protein
MSDYLCRKNRKLYLLLTLPALSLYLFALIIPLCFGTIPTSFYSWNLIKGNKKFCGFHNYIKLFQDDAFLHALLFTIILAVFTIVVSNIIAFLVAFALDGGIRCKAFIRSCFFIPNIISGVMAAFVWMFIFTNAIPDLGKALNLSFLENISWFGSTGMATAAVIIVSSWQSTGFLMMLYIAGLQTVPNDVIEAARLDGCTGIKKIRYIQLPLIMPTITINLFISIAGSFKSLDIPLSLTGGAPAGSTQTIALNIYNDAFGSFKTGYASAKSVVLFLIVSIITIIQLVITRKREVQL